MKNPLSSLLGLFVNKNMNNEEDAPDPKGYDDPFMVMIANYMNDERYLNCRNGSFHSDNDREEISRGTGNVFPARTRECGECPHFKKKYAGV